MGFLNRDKKRSTFSKPATPQPTRTRPESDSVKEPSRMTDDGARNLAHMLQIYMKDDEK